MARREQQQARTVVAQGGPAAQDGPSRALQLVTQEIDNRLAIIGTSSAAGIRPKRLKLVALTAFTRTPALWTCDPVSVARAIVEAGQLGLEPTGLLGGAYLVPRGNQATLLVGYRGLVMLAKRSGEVQRVEARTVRARDTFEYAYGIDQRLEHVPSRELDPGELVAAYALLVYRDGERQFDVMSAAEIEAIRKRSSSPGAGPWVTDYFEMAKKTVLRRLMKLAPLTVEVAAQLDELDPEAPEHERAAATDPRQAELRAQLQRELQREYGGEPVEGEAREVPPTTQPAATGTRSGPGQAPVEEPAAEPEPPAQTPAAPAASPPDTGPESVGEILGTGGEVLGTVEGCGVSWDAMETGPCTLPAGHKPEGEHRNAGGMRWSQPRG